MKMKIKVKMEIEKTDYKEEAPPIFSTWNQLYAFVLVFHALLITAFYFFTQAYS